MAEQNQIFSVRATVHLFLLVRDFSTELAVALVNILCGTFSRPMWGCSFQCSQTLCLFVLKFKPLSSFSRHSLWKNSFRTTLFCQSLLCNHIQNLHLVNADITSGSDSVAWSPKQNGLECVYKPGTMSYMTESQEKQRKNDACARCCMWH